MKSDAKTRFIRALRSLDQGAFVAFVAALWAARGWEPMGDSAPVDIHVHREGRGIRSVRVVDGPSAWSAIVRLSVRPADADVVVTRRRLAAVAVDGIEPVRSRATFEHVSVDDLYVRFRYGLGDAEQDRLWRESLDGLDAGSDDSIVSTTPSHLGDVLDRATSIVPTSALVGCLILAVIVAAAVVGPSVVLPGAIDAPVSVGNGATEATASPADAPTATAAPPVTTQSAAMPGACPVPPADAHPAAIRPGIVRTASTSGLEGWSIRFEGNMNDFDPNDESNRVAPIVRHFVVYETPDDRQYRLAIDHWESAARASERTMQAEQGHERASLVWGPYSIVVEPYAAVPERTAADVSVLLANVQTPGGITLGNRCVDTLSPSRSP